MRTINEIIVHCTATPPLWRDNKSTSSKVAEVKRWHVSSPPVGRGWRDIGYHFLIDRDGTVANGRPVAQVGAHTLGHNQGTIGVALFGGHGSSANDRFADNYTPAQDEALRDLLEVFSVKYPIKKISGHNEYAAKACPGFNVTGWLKSAAKPAPKASPKPSPLAAFFAAIAAFLRGEK